MKPKWLMFIAGFCMIAGLSVTLSAELTGPHFKKVTELTGVVPSAISFSPDSKTLAVSGFKSLGAGGITKQFRVGTWTSGFAAKFGYSTPNSILFAADSKRLYLGGAHLAITRGTKVEKILWKPNDPCATLEAMPEFPFNYDCRPNRSLLHFTGEGMAATPDGKYLIAGKFRGLLENYHLNEEDPGIDKVFDAVSGQELYGIFGAGNPTGAPIVSANGRTLALVSKDIQIWDITLVPWKLKRIIPEVGSDHPRQIAISPDGKYIAVPYAHCSTGVYDTLSGQMVAELHLKTNDSIAAFDPKGKFLATTGLGGWAIDFWEIGSWKHLSELRLNHGEILEVCLGKAPNLKSWTKLEFVEAIAFSPDGHYLAVAALTVHRVSTRSGKVLVYKRK